jgi:hypothetical protein
MAYSRVGSGTAGGDVRPLIEIRIEGELSMRVIH